MNKIYQAYYTNSTYIKNYMISKLNLTRFDKVLEPCVGEGAFVDKILEINSNQNLTLYDIDDYAIDVVKQKYLNKLNVKINLANTLLNEKLDFCNFDKIIGNPPYGAKMSQKLYWNYIIIMFIVIIIKKRTWKKVLFFCYFPFY